MQNQQKTLIFLTKITSIRYHFYMNTKNKTSKIILQKIISTVIILCMLTCAFCSVASAQVASKQYSTGTRGLALIKNREGFRSTKYWDVNAYRIGYGTTWNSSIPDPITEKEAADLLVSVLKNNYEPYLDKFLYKNNVRVTQNQYDALIDITYNIGPGLWSMTKYSDCKLIALLKAGNFTKDNVYAAFTEFKGNRRVAEAELFCSDIKTYSLFSDVADQSWYYSYVKWAKERGIMSGTGTNTFSPTALMTRAMTVTTIAKMSGLNMSAYTSSVFSDVPTGKWYTSAVGWANAKGIVTGTNLGVFCPDTSITRQDFILIIYKYGRAYQGVSDWSQKNLTIVGFTDSGSVSSYAYTAVAWALRKGIVSGTSSSTISPKKKITRAEAAVILKAFFEYCS